MKYKIFLKKSFLLTLVLCCSVVSSYKTECTSGLNKNTPHSDAVNSEKEGKEGKLKKIFTRLSQVNEGITFFNNLMDLKNNSLLNGMLAAASGTKIVRLIVEKPAKASPQLYFWTFMTIYFMYKTKVLSDASKRESMSARRLNDACLKVDNEQGKKNTLFWWCDLIKRQNK